MSATNKTGFIQIGVDPSKLEAIKQGKNLKVNLVLPKVRK